MLGINSASNMSPYPSRSKKDTSTDLPAWLYPHQMFIGGNGNSYACNMKQSSKLGPLNFSKSCLASIRREDRECCEEDVCTSHLVLCEHLVNALSLPQSSVERSHSQSGCTYAHGGWWAGLHRQLSLRQNSDASSQAWEEVGSSLSVPSA